MDDEHLGSSTGYFGHTRAPDARFWKLSNVIGVSILEALIFLPIRNILTVRQVWYMPSREFLLSSGQAPGSAGRVEPRGSIGAVIKDTIKDTMASPASRDTMTNPREASFTQGPGPPPGGPLETALRIIKFRQGKLSSLHKGFLPEILLRSLGEMLTSKATFFVYRILFGIVKFSEDFTVETSSRKILVAKVFGQVLGALILRPLSLVQTRLIVQEESGTISNTSRNLYRIYKEEGGMFALFFGPSFFSFFLYQLVISISNHAMNYSIFSLGLTPGSLTYAGCKMLLKSLELLLIIPLETVSSRLACQERMCAGTLERKKRPKLLPEVSPLYYTSTFDCFERICFEESEGALEKTSAPSDAPQEETKPAFGLRGLYREFELRWVASLLVLMYYVHKSRLELAH